MKAVIALCIIMMVWGCSNPYLSPATSKAISEQEQIQELKEQNVMLQEQNKQLTRIANSLEILAAPPKNHEILLK